MGKLLRTLYLCDYLGNPAFRADILSLLNQGEAVHSLERAIHGGGIGAKRGRTPEQLAAISGALSLVANILMTWNAWRMQAVVRRAPEQFPQELLGQIAPVAHAHVNMRGIFTFALGPHRRALLSPVLGRLSAHSPHCYDDPCTLDAMTCRVWGSAGLLTGRMA